uniref:Fibronectin type-III domain-containing protein n=1 Tax=Kryptolebias marmoratus TaxID=37003 RepID=A0A3Q3F0T0_KRYMA
MHLKMILNSLSRVLTVPATSQITFSKAISSTSIKFEWSNVTGADSYILFVEETMTSTAKIYNQTYTTTSAQVNGLTPSTTYECYIYSSNSAGRGAKSNIRTILTLYDVEYLLVSVPCGPEDVRASVSCGTNELTVTWNMSASAENYTTTVSSGVGQTLHCNSTETQCTMAGLLCESSYTVTVSSITGTCSSLPSSEISVQTLPCPPTNVTTEHRCAPHPVPVLWTPSGNAKHYITVAESSTGHRAECTSNNTSCSLSGLQCGEIYTISVAGADDTCTGNTTLTNTKSLILNNDVPCAPENVTTNLLCGSSDLMVSWTSSPLPLNYSVIAKPLDGNTSLLTCHTNRVLITAPCPPSVQSSTLICSNSSALLSWTTMAHAKGYSAEATAADGTKVSCSSLTASCTLTDLLCSETYVATVKAQGNQCDSAPGSNTTPCSPALLSKAYTCGTNTAVVSWSKPAGSISFLSQVVGEGYQDSCHTANTTCVFKNLPCGLDFNVISDSLQTGKERDRFCLHMNPSFVCLSLMTWVGSIGAVGYNVTVTGQNGHNYHCETNSTSCQIPDLHCGEAYIATVTPYSQTCTGTQSTAYNFKDVFFLYNEVYLLQRGKKTD